MTFKTLKDIDWEKELEQCKSKPIKETYPLVQVPASLQARINFLLKQEAIKWVKAIQKALDDSEKAYDEKPVNSCSGDVVIGGCEFSWAYPDFEDFSSAIRILKHIYNITEEDIK